MVEAFQAIQSHRFRFLGTGESLIHLIYIDDLIEALLLAGKCDNAIGKVYFVGMKEPVTWKEYVNAISETMGMDPPNGHIPAWLAKMLGFCSEIVLRPFSKEEPYLVQYRVDWTTKSSACDISKAIRELGFEPKTSLREGLEKTVEWYRKEGYLK
jgi:nucleoside-diphosphate-sugar epimerase